MLLDNLWQYLQEAVFTLPGAEGEHPAFNFYRQEIVGIDLPGAAKIRRSNLWAYLDSFTQSPGALLVGEAPGWRGCRFSGAPFTSEAQLCCGELPFVGQASSVSDRPYQEASATIFWRIMGTLHPTFFAWNAFPLHPYLPGKPFSNRKPCPHEIEQGAQLLRQIVEILKPYAVVAVGKSAGAALELAGIEHTLVRHPSHGGARDFQAGIERLQKYITIGG